MLVYVSLPIEILVSSVFNITKGSIAINMVGSLVSVESHLTPYISRAYYRKKLLRIMGETKQINDIRQDFRSPG